MNTMNMESLNIEKELLSVEKTALPKKMSKNVINIIRTTLRNDIELTGIADNKANVLLSLNALMLTFMFPLMLPHMDIIKDYNLVYPLIILIITSLTTIYMAAFALMPGKFFENQSELRKGRYISPFFFGNFFKMNQDQFKEYIRDAVSDTDLVKRHIIEDLHYIGSRLGQKMNLIRRAFKVFLFGFSVSISLALTLILLH